MKNDEINIFKNEITENSTEENGTLEVLEGTNSCLQFENDESSPKHSLQPSSNAIELEFGDGISELVCNLHQISLFRDDLASTTQCLNTHEEVSTLDNGDSIEHEDETLHKRNKKQTFLTGHSLN